jgi:hypothetical protein
VRKSWFSVKRRALDLGTCRDFGAWVEMFAGSTTARFVSLQDGCHDGVVFQMSEPLPLSRNDGPLLLANAPGRTPPTWVRQAAVSSQHW